MSEPNFRIYSTGHSYVGVPFYYIESTAPDNVDEQNLEEKRPPKYLSKSEDPNLALKAIAEQLLPEAAPADGASLVVMVHGFNTPFENAVNTYEVAAEALIADKDKIFTADRRVVCIGYRWPSEKIGSNWRSSLSALPKLPQILLGTGVLFLLFRLFLFHGDQTALVSFLLQAGVFIALSLIVITIVGIVLRAIVYFRDIYRATNYGVSDLVQIIRLIDFEASNRIAKDKRAFGQRRRIALSFIGHSMGGLVVTNVIRTLTDVFDSESNVQTASGANTGYAADSSDVFEQIPARVGHVFELMRFIVVSPDIPAEALLARRGNFLQSSLRRFKEAYLFSNEGDVVLRLISTVANYFSFPTLKNRSGYRLGNTEILSNSYGEVSVNGSEQLLEILRVGSNKLSELSRTTAQSRTAKEAAKVADAFSYFDCTDYVEDHRGMLTLASKCKARDPEGAISYIEYARLLLRYLFLSPNEPKSKYVNVHGGYFYGQTTKGLIYRLACLGYDDTVAVYGGEAAIFAKCNEHQIRVLISRRLRRKGSVGRNRTELIDSSLTKEDPPTV